MLEPCSQRAWSFKTARVPPQRGSCASAVLLPVFPATFDLIRGVLSGAPCLFNFDICFCRVFPRIVVSDPDADPGRITFLVRPCQTVPTAENAPSRLTPRTANSMTRCSRDYQRNTATTRRISNGIPRNLTTQSSSARRTHQNLMEELSLELHRLGRDLVL